MSIGLIKVGSLIAVGALLLGGCSRGSWSPEQESWSTEQLAKRIGRATHVVASDSYHGSMRVVSGEEATNLIRAVSSSQGIRKDISADTAPVCKLEFVSETNLLATILVQGEWFGTEEKGEYLEKTGVLEALQRGLESDTSARQTWVDRWALEVLHTREVSAIKDWSAALISRYEAGMLKVGRQDDGPSGVVIPYNERPQWLRAPQAYIHKDSSVQPDCVVLEWNYYGLVVGHTNRETTFRAWYMTNIYPGVVAYHTGK